MDLNEVDKFRLKVFKDEVATQCRFALLAYDDLKAAYEKVFDAINVDDEHLPPNPRREDFPDGNSYWEAKRTYVKARMAGLQRWNAEWAQRRQGRSAATDRLWFSLHALLEHTTIVTRLLFSGKGDIPNRAKDLRKALGLNDRSVLKRSGIQRVRNWFEHYDEYLEKVLIEEGGIIDSNLGPFRSDRSSLRQFDPQAMRAGILDREVEIEPVVEELRRILAAATA